MKSLYPFAALVLFAACTEPLRPTQEVPEPVPTARADCLVDVRAQTLSCSAARVTGAILAGPSKDILIGGQDVFVKISSFGTTWDAGTQVLSSNVQLQNLMQYYLGTADGATVTGAKVFFQSGPATSSGTGVVTVANADGTSTFTTGTQPYFNYNQIISPIEISSARNWQFNVPSTVVSFTFTLLISANVSGTGPMFCPIWTGSTSTAWSNAGNWKNGLVPDSASIAQVPPDSLIASPNMPVASGNISLTGLKVGFGSTLDLNGFTANVYGNVDAIGTISNGTVMLRGTSSLVGGSLPALLVTDAARLQRATKTSRAVSIAGGSLSVKDQALTIALP